METLNATRPPIDTADEVKAELRRGCTLLNDSDDASAYTSYVAHEIIVRAVKANVALPKKDRLSRDYLLTEARTTCGRAISDGMFKHLSAAHTLFPTCPDGALECAAYNAVANGVLTRFVDNIIRNNKAYCAQIADKVSERKATQPAGDTTDTDSADKASDHKPDSLTLPKALDYLRRYTRRAIELGASHDAVTTAVCEVLDTLNVAEPVAA